LRGAARVGRLHVLRDGEHGGQGAFADFTLAATLTLDPGGTFCAALDASGGYVYFGTALYQSRGALVKVRLSDFTQVSYQELMPGEGNPRWAVLDASAGYAYFGTSGFTIPGVVAKVRLSDFNRVGTPDATPGCTLRGAGRVGRLRVFRGASTAVKVRLSDSHR